MEKVHPRVLEKIYNLLTKSKSTSLNKLKKKFCPNVSKYKDKILVRLFHIFEDDTGVFLSNEILTSEDFRRIGWNEKIYLGSITGKNTNVYLTLNDMIIDVFEDPYVIYTFVEIHRGLVVDGCGYLGNFLSEKKKAEEESDFSEEVSEEETDEYDSESKDEDESD